jgi:hypothetical protein
MEYQQHGDERVGLQMSPSSGSYHRQSGTLDFDLDNVSPMKNQPPIKECYSSLGVE